MKALTFRQVAVLTLVIGAILVAALGKGGWWLFLLVAIMVPA